MIQYFGTQAMRFTHAPSVAFIFDDNLLEVALGIPGDTAWTCLEICMVEICMELVLFQTKQ